MLNIDPKFLIGKKFHKSDPQNPLTCIGIGINPEGNGVFVVGAYLVGTDTKLITVLLRDATFSGDITQ